MLLAALASAGNAQQSDVPRLRLFIGERRSFPLDAPVSRLTVIDLGPVSAIYAGTVVELQGKDFGETPASGAGIIAKGAEKEFQTTAAANGKYMLREMPGGKVRVAAVIPAVRHSEWIVITLGAQPSINGNVNIPIRLK